MNTTTSLRFTPVLEIQDLRHAVQTIPGLVRFEDGGHRTLLTVLLLHADGRSEDDLLTDVRLLVEAGADPSGGAGRAMALPLEAAFRHLHVRIARYLLAQGACPNDRNARGQNAVFWATQAALSKNDLGIFTDVLDAGGDVMVVGAGGQTVLDAVLASIPGNRGAARRLLEKMARVLKSRGAPTPGTDYMRSDEYRRGQHQVAELFRSGTLP